MWAALGFAKMVFECHVPNSAPEFRPNSAQSIQRLAEMETVVLSESPLPCGEWLGKGLHVATERVARRLSFAQLCE
jgi:hypothetical protein